MPDYRLEHFINGGYSGHLLKLLLRLCASILLYTSLLSTSLVTAEDVSSDPDRSISDLEANAPPTNLVNAPVTAPAFVDSARVTGLTPAPKEGVNWRGLFEQSLFFLSAQHAFRLATEPGTRSGLKGPFWKGYMNSISSLHGWADGDPFYVNYVGHSMQGSAASWIWIHNDRRYREAEFGRNREYWRSRLRAAAFSWVYSTQFEIGPVSEASIGKTQAQHPQHGLVDHAITPLIGFGWLITEDAIDKHVIQRLERATENFWLRLAMRIGLNPTRSFANALRFKEPWYRDTRPGVGHPNAGTNFRQRSITAGKNEAVPVAAPLPGVAPLEFTIGFRPQLPLNGRGAYCLGGGGTGAFRLSVAWQLVADVYGCKVRGLDQDLSADSLSYMLGPRWNSPSLGNWSSHLQVLLGGNRLSEERMLPEEWRRLRPLVEQSKIPGYLRDQYVIQDDTNAFAMTAGGGVDYKINNALAVRVAGLSYRHSWARSLSGFDANSGLEFTTGLVLRMGTW